MSSTLFLKIWLEAQPPPTHPPTNPIPLQKRVGGVHTNLYTRFFISSTFISNARLKLTKNQANTKQHPEAELFPFVNYSQFPSMLSSKNNTTHWKIRKRTSASVFIRLIIMKMKLKMKNRSHRYDINRPRSRHGHRYSKYKKCLTMIMFICSRQHLSNIWSLIHEKIKQHLGWVKKSIAYKKKCIKRI